MSFRVSLQDVSETWEAGAGSGFVIVLLLSGLGVLLLGWSLPKTSFSYGRFGQEFQCIVMFIQ